MTVSRSIFGLSLISENNSPKNVTAASECSDPSKANRIFILLLMSPPKPEGAHSHYKINTYTQQQNTLPIPIRKLTNFLIGIMIAKMKVNFNCLNTNADYFMLVNIIYW
jgi:hypothetical protein